jgi:hypothetical protein
MKGPCQLTHLCHTTKQNPDAEILNMIRRHDGLSHELDRLDGDDPRWEALSHEGEMLGVEIVFAKVSTPEALAGKRPVVAREMLDEDEIVRLILSADAERIAAARRSNRVLPRQERGRQLRRPYRLPLRCSPLDNSSTAKFATTVSPSSVVFPLRAFNFNF